MFDHIGNFIRSTRSPRADRPQLPTATVRCPDCSATPGDQHELSCPEVSPELAAAYIEAVHGAKES
jgi:hypothetical protein